MTHTQTIDPNNLSDVNQRALLGSLFAQHPNTLFSPKETYQIRQGSQQQTIQLSSFILKRSSEKNPHEIRFEPHGEMIGHGVFGEVLNSTGALKLTADEHAVTVNIANQKKNRVIKYLKKTDAETDADFQQRVTQEYELAKILGQLHPKKPVFFTHTDKSAAGIVMRKIGEFSLTELLATYSLSLEERCALSISVLQAVTKLLECGIVHRDLKPDNIRINLDNGNFTATVVDFGLAKLATNLLNPSNQCVGTLLHAAPEVLKKKQYSHASDAFSAGKILWEIWGGRVNFVPAETEKERRQQIFKENTLRPLAGIFNNITGLDTRSENKIKETLSKLMLTAPASRLSLADAISKLNEIKLPPLFFRTAEGVALMKNLEQGDRNKLAALLPKITLPLDNQHADDVLIKQIVTYLKQGFSKKQPAYGFFFFPQNISACRLKTVHEILQELSQGNHRTAVTHHEKLPEGSRLKKAIQEGSAIARSSHTDAAAVLRF